MCPIGEPQQKFRPKNRTPPGLEHLGKRPRSLPFKGRGHQLSVICSLCTVSFQSSSRSSTRELHSARLTLVVCLLKWRLVSASRRRSLVRERRCRRLNSASTLKRSNWGLAHRALVLRLVRTSSFSSLASLRPYRLRQRCPVPAGLTPPGNLSLDLSKSRPSCTSHGEASWRSGFRLPCCVPLLP
jgi:hypothetical protein